MQDSSDLPPPGKLIPLSSDRAYRRAKIRRGRRANAPLRRGHVLPTPRLAAEGSDRGATGEAWTITTDAGTSITTQKPT
jgi:hypothetical protein